MKKRKNEKKNCSIIELYEIKNNILSLFFLILTIVYRLAMMNIDHHLLTFSHILLLMLNRVVHEVKDIVQLSYYHSQDRPFDSSVLSNVPLILHRSSINTKIGNFRIYLFSTVSGGICWATRNRINFNTSSLLKTSQIPSQAITINSQSSLIVLVMTSGAAKQWKTIKLNQTKL